MPITRDVNPCIVVPAGKCVPPADTGIGRQLENPNSNSIQQEGKFQYLTSVGDLQFRLGSFLCQVLSDGKCTLYFEMPASPN